MKPKLTPASSKPCPCTSGQPYRLCCGPYHAGTEAPSALALMRSRYGAFAVGSPDYLYRTLHPAHTDRSKPREAVMRELIWAAQNNRYLGLTILDHDEADATGTARVLFWARVFQRGNDVSIVELSEFQQAEGGWRYLAGDCRSAELVEGDLATLTIALWRAADEAARAEDEAASAPGEAAPAP